MAEQVWVALGDVDAYFEPFAGSLAVLLERPAFPLHRGTVETVNDMDDFLVNFWRALAAAPKEVAHHANWPVTETDLLARHRWLLKHGRRRLLGLKLRRNDTAYDAKVAGRWVWGMNVWIGSGWCTKVGKSKLPSMGSGSGLGRQSFYTNGQPDEVKVLAYLNELAHRLRRVRVVNGDWKRILTPGCLSFGDTIGVFFDPPYAGVGSDKIYREKPGDHISREVREWCIKHGEDKRLRIVLAGYSDEHEKLMPSTWRRCAYSAGSSFQSSESAKGEGGNTSNRHKERLWLSPHCESAPVARFSLHGGR